RIGGDSRSRQPSAGALAAPSLRGFGGCGGWTIGAPPCPARKRAATPPSSAEQRKALRPPPARCLNHSGTRALAEPVQREQVWNENTWVMRRGETRSDSKV